MKSDDSRSSSDQDYSFKASQINDNASVQQKKEREREREKESYFFETKEAVNFVSRKSRETASNRACYHY